MGRVEGGLGGRGTTADQGTGGFDGEEKERGDDEGGENKKHRYKEEGDVGRKRGRKEEGNRRSAGVGEKGGRGAENMRSALVGTT